MNLNDDLSRGFRFQRLEIWKLAADLAIELDEIAATLDDHRRYRFAEQLRAAGLSISNNIAEGSGSDSKADFRRFLFIARKSTFESASMVMIFERRNLISQLQSEELVARLETVSKMIYSFTRTLQG